MIAFTASGTGAMEAAVANTLSPGDTVLVVRAGKFGERWEEICRAYGITAVPIAAPFGETVPPERVAEALRAHPAARAVLMQHSESSTAVLHDVRGIAAVTRDSGAILVVDAVSSLGIANLEMDAWGVDLVVAGSQKGLMLPPGLCLLRRERARVGARRGLPAAQVLLRPGRRARSGSAGASPASRRRSPSCSACRRSCG